MVRTEFRGDYSRNDKLLRRDSLCPIRQCAREKQMETCGGCLEMKSCEKVGAIIGNNSDARGRLENTGYV